MPASMPAEVRRHVKTTFSAYMGGAEVTCVLCELSLIACWAGASQHTEARLGGCLLHAPGCVRYWQVLERARLNSTQPNSTQPNWQVLEGPVKKVRLLFKTITADTRHLGCEILHMEETTGPRKFSSFGMSKGSEAISREEFLAMVIDAASVNAAFAMRAEWVTSQQVAT